MGEFMGQDKGQSIIAVDRIAVANVQRAFGDDHPTVRDRDRQRNVERIALENK